MKAGIALRKIRRKAELQLPFQPAEPFVKGMSCNPRQHGATGRGFDRVRHASIDRIKAVFDVPDGDPA